MSYHTKRYEKGMVTVSYVVNDSGTVIRIDTIKKVYSINTINPPHYSRAQQNVEEL